MKTNSLCSAMFDDAGRRLNLDYCGRTRKLSVNENIFSNVCNYQENVLQSRIVSGTLSKPGTVPWQVACNTCLFDLSII